MEQEKLMVVKARIEREKLHELIWSMPQKELCETWEISSKMLTDAITKVSQAQRLACDYTSKSHFKIAFRDSAAKEQYGWILEMVDGFANHKPRSEFLTKDATRWQRFKHKAKKLKNKLT